MSVKISFMHYMKWIRAILPVVFKEFELVCIFLLQPPQKTDEIKNQMKSLKYRRKIRRNAPFQDERVDITDEKVDESGYIRFE